MKFGIKDSNNAVELRESTQFASGDAFSVHYKNEKGWRHIGYIANSYNDGYRGYDRHFNPFIAMPGSLNKVTAAMQVVRCYLDSIHNFTLPEE